MNHNDKAGFICIAAGLLITAATTMMCGTRAHAGDGVMYVVDLTAPAVQVPAGMAPQLYDRIRCESSWRPNVVNAESGTAGLLQVHPVHRTRIERMGFSWLDMLSPSPNIAVAAAIWREQGWLPWVNSDRCVKPY